MHTISDKHTHTYINRLIVFDCGLLPLTSFFSVSLSQRNSLADYMVPPRTCLLTQLIEADVMAITSNNTFSISWGLKSHTYKQFHLWLTAIY